MSEDRPSCSTPVGGRVQVNVPPGWYAYATGPLQLSRTFHNQMLRLHIKEGDNVKTEYLNGDLGETDGITKCGTYAIARSSNEIILTLDSFYSPSSQDQGKARQKPITSKGLSIKQAETPPHLKDDFPDYVTFFILVQDTAEQEVPQDSPLYNDALCTINVIKGTGYNHRGEPIDESNAMQKINAEPTNSRPSCETPAGHSVKVNIPAGWFAFVSGLSRAKYNQAIKLTYDDGQNTNAEVLTSELGSTDDIMRLKRTREGYYVFVSSEEIDIQLETSFYWSKSNIKGQALAKPQFASHKLKHCETGTAASIRDDFPDYVTYFVRAEDQPDAEQNGRIPDYNDAVAIVNLIKNTPMVYTLPSDDDQ
ncbi:hypothetical protein D9613_003980 [Agrocybe pediades]|uniref:Uncharacterized protein n=1 Tax=Agrocybe pediades TaxID=84607 RepID=A0A8H4QIB8_9AGAR|nr:hypothetical protein D9613_003980 [Agrocybe pediades]